MKSIFLALALIATGVHAAEDTDSTPCDGIENDKQTLECATYNKTTAEQLLKDPAVKSISSFIGVDGGNTTLNTGDALDGVDGNLRDNPDASFWWDKSTRVADALEEVMEKNLGSFQLSW